MSEGSAWIVPIRLKVSRVDYRFEGRLDLRCMGCEAPLEVHQPDSEHPDRILGTCERCRGWVIVDFAPESDDGVMVFLPGGNFLPTLPPLV